MRRALLSHIKIGFIVTVILSFSFRFAPASPQSMEQNVPSTAIAIPKFFQKDSLLEITPFGAIHCWSEKSEPLGSPSSIDIVNQQFELLNEAWNIGACWWEERDIQGVEIRFEKNVADVFATGTKVQYWQRTWPEPPPEMPTLEDKSDDSWQGQWLNARTRVKIDQNTIRYTFQPMVDAENKNASFLPGDANYRRTLKVRLVFPQRPDRITAFRVYSMSHLKKVSLRLELECGIQKQSTMTGTLEIFNGYFDTISGWNWDRLDTKTSDNGWQIWFDDRAKGVQASIWAAAPLLPGSNDETIVTVRSTSGAFSFSVDDLDNGPIYVPYYHAYVTNASDLVSFSEATVVQGQTIREKLWQEPEQTFDQATREIPALDPTQRDPRHEQRYIYMPLAADASWQKFAVIWGGNIMIDKRRTKARGKELARCNWQGNDLRWEIGAGKNILFDRTPENCQMSLLHDYLPVVQARWLHEGLIYEEEMFATLLSGPLSPNDSNRNEQTPAMLLVKLMVSNPTNKPVEAQVWLSGNKALSHLILEKDFLKDRLGNKTYLRCHIKAPHGTQQKLMALGTTTQENVLQQSVSLAANSSCCFFFYFPFVGDLTADYQSKIASLDYDAAKQRVVSYWRNVVCQQTIFNVPEPKFNELAKAVIWHIRMSATKCPKSGLYMIPAGTLGYWVYANESCFQTVLLDRLGDHQTVTNYLDSFLKLQGSRSLPGAFTGSQADVFYGVKVDSEYDLTATGYNLHHGTVLWALARHFLFTQDTTWLHNAAPHMIRAGNWIIEQRQHTMTLDENGDKALHYGLLPAGRLEDPDDWQYWFAVNSYSWLGLKTMADALTIANLPQAAYFQQQAEAYRADLRRSVERASERCPVVRLRNNTYVPYLPAHPYQRFRYFGSKKAQYYDRYQKGVYPTLRLSATREVLYGPMILIKTGLVDATEPMADWILDDWEDNLTLSSSLNINPHGWVDDEYWFSRGGMVFQANLQNPIEVYLMRHEIPAAIRNLYNSMVSCLFPDVNMLVEEYRCWQHGSGHFYKVSDEARFVNRVCDLLVLEVGDELWLAPGTSRRWLEPGQRIELKKAHTVFGEVSYSLSPGEQPQSIEACIDMPTRRCKNVWLFVRAPFNSPIQAVQINGKPWLEWNANREAILLPQGDDRIDVTINY